MGEELLKQAVDTQAGGEDAGGALESIDDIASAFMGEDTQGDAGEDAGEQLGDEEAQAEAEQDGEAEAEGEAEEQPEADIPLPEGIDAALWEGAAPELRAAIHAREQAHAAEIGQERQNYADLRAHREQFAIQANGQIQQALQIMRGVCEGEYANVNWQQLAQSDPATYIQLQQQYQQRMGAIQGIQRSVAQATQAYEQRRGAEHQALMQREFSAVAPEIKAMMGNGFEGKAFAGEVAQYLAGQGCPAEVINSLSKGYELKMVAKAMLWDKAQTQRTAALKKVAEAPKVQAPRGKRGMEAPNARLERARSLLNKNPNSTDALAAVFEAM